MGGTWRNRDLCSCRQSMGGKCICSISVGWGFFLVKVSHILPNCEKAFPNELCLKIDTFRMIINLNLVNWFMESCRSKNTFETHVFLGVFFPRLFYFQYCPIFWSIALALYIVIWWLLLGSHVDCKLSCSMCAHAVYWNVRYFMSSAVLSMKMAVCLSLQNNNVLVTFSL